MIPLRAMRPWRARGFAFRAVRALALGCTALLAAGCSDAGEGPDPRQHPTIVSLNPCTDAVLAEVAAPGQLLAISHYSHDPRASSMDIATARRFPVTGGTVEEVLALNPDMVVAGGFLSPATQAAFTRLGVQVETFGIAGSVAESHEQTRRLAALVGDAAAGEALIQRIDSSLQPEPQGDLPSATLWQPGGIVPGDTQLISELLRRAGFASHSARQGLGQADYLPLERVVADPPDVLLVAGNQRGQSHPVLRDLPDMRLARLDPNLLFCGGPAIIRAMARLREVRESL